MSLEGNDSRLFHEHCIIILNPYFKYFQNVICNLDLILQYVYYMYHSYIYYERTRMSYRDLKSDLRTLC